MIAYLPTCFVDLYGFHVVKYAIDAASNEFE